MYQRRAPLLLVLRDPVYHGIATQVAQIAGGQTSNGWLKPTQKHNLTGIRVYAGPIEARGATTVAFLWALYLWSLAGLMTWQLVIL
jgi:hypothetical protein